MAYRRWLEGRQGQAPRMHSTPSSGQEVHDLPAAGAARPEETRDGLQSTLANATIAKKFAALRRIYDQLAEGGRFIFDFFVFDPEYVRYRSGLASLRAEYTDAASGHDVLLWVAVRHDLEKQQMRIITWADELDEEGVVLERRYRPLSFSWIDPEQARELLEQTGFEVETVYGDFQRGPFTADSGEQIWVARKPAAG